MKFNLLEFETKKGTHLLFDNCTGIVIENKKHTRYLLEHINEEKNVIKENLIRSGIFEKEDFEKDYYYLKYLINNGYFSDKKITNISSFDREDIFKGISSHLILIMTEECNLRCTYCIYSDHYIDKKTYSSKFMTTETALKAVDLFKKLHDEKKKRGYKDQPKINFYGGEPLLNFDTIKKVIAYVNKLNFENVEYMITTNGTVMNNEILDFLAKNNFIVSFSLDGDEFNHNRNRISINGKKTHEIVVRNIIKYHDMLKVYKRNSLINIICCFDNYTNMEKVVSFFEELKNKVKNLNFIYNKIYDVDTTYYNYCEEKYANSSNVNRTTYSESIQTLFEKFYTNEKCRDIPESIQSIFKSYYIMKNRKKGVFDFYQGNACIIGDKICISPDEKIYICEKANQEIEIGNLEQGLNYGEIKKIYETYYQIRDKYCSKCSVNRLCDVCYVHFIKKNQLQFNENYCKKRKEVLKKGIAVVYSLLEENKRIFDLN